MVIHPAKFLDEVHVFERNISDVCLRHAHVCWSNFCWWNIIYIYMWGWGQNVSLTMGEFPHHEHSWNQLCKGSRVPRFWPIASHNNTRPSTAGRTLGCRSGTASGDGIRFALLWGGTGRFPPSRNVTDVWPFGIRVGRVMIHGNGYDMLYIYIY